MLPSENVLRKMCSHVGLDADWDVRKYVARQLAERLATETNTTNIPFVLDMFYYELLDRLGIQAWNEATSEVKMGKRYEAEVRPRVEQLLQEIRGAL